MSTYSAEINPTDLRVTDAAKQMKNADVVFFGESHGHGYGDLDGSVYSRP